MFQGFFSEKNFNKNISTEVKPLPRTESTHAEIELRL